MGFYNLTLENFNQEIIDKILNINSKIIDINYQQRDKGNVKLIPYKIFYTIKLENKEEISEEVKYQTELYEILYNWGLKKEWFKPYNLQTFGIINSWEEIKYNNNKIVLKMNVKVVDIYFTILINEFDFKRFGLKEGGKIYLYKDDLDFWKIDYLKLIPNLDLDSLVSKNDKKGKCIIMEFNSIMKFNKEVVLVRVKLKDDFATLFINPLTFNNRCLFIGKEIFIEKNEKGYWRLV